MRKERPSPSRERQGPRGLEGALGVAALALALGGSGCVGLVGSTGPAPDAPLWLHHPGSAMSIALRRTVSAKTRQADEAYERGKPELDPPRLRMFVGSSDHGLYALRTTDGATIWRFETLDGVQCEPLYDSAEDVVYFGSDDGALYKVRALDGKLIWRFATNAKIGRRPVIRDGVVYVVNANDTLLALDASTGALRWNQHRTPAAGMEVSGYAGPALGADKVYTAFSDGVVSAFSLRDGAEQWPSVDLAAEAEQGSAGGDVPRHLDVDTTPIVARIDSGVVVFVASYEGGVHALDAEGGTRAWMNERVTGVNDLMLWEQPAHRGHDGSGPEMPARRLLLAASGQTGLWALDPNDGHTVWRKNLPEGGITAPVPVLGALLVGTTRYGLFLMSPLDGAVIDAIDTGSGFAMTPAAYGGRAFVMTNGGQLLGFQVQAP